MTLRQPGLLLAALALALAGSAEGQVKRPLTHKDADSWRAIAAPVVSADGKLLAYGLSPQEGDGEVVLRDLNSGKEHRHARGSAPGPLAPRGATLFSPEGKVLVFPVYPSKDKSKGKAPTAGLALMDTATGKTTVIDKVRSFQVGKSGPDVIVFHREPAGGMPKTPAEKGIVPKGKKGGGAAAPTPQVAIPSELVLRDLATGKERTFADVTEYSLSKDGKLIVYAVSPKSEGTAGVFAAFTEREAPPLALKSGPGRYARLTWDDKQEQIAFFHTKPANPNDKESRPEVKLFHWKRAKEAPMAVTAKAEFNNLQAVAFLASELSASNKDAFRPGCSLSDAALSFALDGDRLFFNVTTPPPPKATPGEEKAVVELWHHKDDFIQPMQKVRFLATKTYRAAFKLSDRVCRQFTDETMTNAVTGPGDWAIGFDDRAYRSLVGSEEVSPPLDVSLLNIATGQRKPLLKKVGGASLSPGGKYALTFDGKDWISLSVPEGKRVNLTEKLKGKFAQELHDTPNAAPPYGVGGWTLDDSRVFVYDRYDVWSLAPDGSAAKNLTADVGRKNETQFRLVAPEAPARRFDPTKPMLARAESERTRDTGFYRVSPDAAPKLLIMGGRSYNIVKTTKDRILLNVSTFYDYPDLYTADPEFKEVKRVTDANPEKKNYVWGKAEMMSFKTSDGDAMQAVLVKPENFDPNKKYPMIVYIYERLSQNLHQFRTPSPGTSINPTFYASNGYLVLMPDIAYDTGYPGKSALKCVLPAVQAVVDRGNVDEKAIGIQGHSWGGYQTAYMITQTNRFAAASAGAPVSNMTSAYGGIRWGTGLPRQFQYEKTQSRIGGTLWQYPTRFLENSPLMHADRVKTPLLMLHNDQDEAVPWQQGIEYYLALRRLDKEVYMFNYPGEKHGLTKRVNQKDYTVRLQEFFDHKLKGAPKPAWMEKGIPYAPPAPAVRE